MRSPGWTSRRWFGYLKAREAGTYFFDIRAAEHARLLIDGVEIYSLRETARLDPDTLLRFQ